MKKDIWLKPGKELNTGAIIGGIGFAIYIALSALEWRGLALFAALAFGLEAGYAFLSALDCREKPLSVDDFVKKSQYTYFTADALERVAGKVALFAEKEGLSAHARSATVRFEGKA